MWSSIGCRDARRASPGHAGDAIGERVGRFGGAGQPGGGSRPAVVVLAPRMSVHVWRRRLALVRFNPVATSVAATLALNERMRSTLYPATVKASSTVSFVRPKTRKNLCWTLTKPPF